MARLTLINLGLHGHINPTLATVRELVARGETVSYFAPEEFGSVIRSTGAKFFPYRSIFSEPVLGYADASGKTPMPIRLVNDCLQALPQLIQTVTAQNPEALLFDIMCLPGRILAEKLGVPAVKLSSTFVLNDSVPWKPKAVSDPVVLNFVKDGIARLSSDYGVKPFHFQEIFTEPAPLNIIYTTPSFQPKVESFDDRFVFVGAGIEEPWDLNPKKSLPLVYVALGTLANNRPDFFGACREALTMGSAKRAVIAVGKQVDIPGLGLLPSTIQIVPHAPQVQLLKEADLFLSHGGMNSLMEALYFGVPLILFPQTEEQRLNAERVLELGAGIILREENLTAETVAQAMDTVLGDAKYRKNAEVLSQEIRACGGPRKAADAIQGFIKCPST